MQPVVHQFYVDLPHWSMEALLVSCFCSVSDVGAARGLHKVAWEEMGAVTSRPTKEAAFRTRRECEMRICVSTAKHRDLMCDGNESLLWREW